MKFDTCRHVVLIMLFLVVYSSQRVHSETWSQPSYTITTVNKNPVVMTNPTGRHISELSTTPIAVDFDSQSNMYFIDYLNKWVVKVDNATGLMTTLVGINKGSSDPANVDVNNVAGNTIPAFVRDLAVTKSGDVYYGGVNKLKKVNSDGIVSNFNIDTFDNVNIGDGGKAINAKVKNVNGIVVTSKEEVIFADSNRIRKIFTNGTIATIEGDGTDAGNVVSPGRMCIDSSDSVYIVCSASTKIKKLTVGGSLSVVAGSGAPGSVPINGSLATTAAISPISVAIHPISGELYFATSVTISRISSVDGKIYRVAGSGSSGIDSTDTVNALDCLFKDIYSIAFHGNGDLWVVDYTRIRKIISGVIYTKKVEDSVVATIQVFGNDIYYTMSCQLNKIPNGDASSIVRVMGFTLTCTQYFAFPTPVSQDIRIDPFTAFSISKNGNMYYATSRKMWNITNGYVYPMVYNYGEGIDIANGLIDHNLGLCLDNSENLILGDNFRLRFLNTSTRIVKTLLGNSESLFPFTCSVAPNGDIYFKEKQSIRKYSPTSKTLTTLFSVNTDFTGRPYKLKVLSSGALIFTDSQYVKSYYNGVTTTLAGSGSTSSSVFSGEGGPATDAVQSAFVIGLSANSRGEIFYVDESFNSIRKLTPYCSDSSTKLDSTGTKCKVASCYGVDYNSVSVCSGHGSCSSQDNCTCNAGYYGSNCELFTCFGFNQTDPKACSGNGTCTDLNTCSCAYGYPPECKDYVCYGLAMNDANVCSSHGKCNGINKCACNSPYYGSICENFNCYNISSTNASVCNGNGACSAPDTCTCQYGFLPKCYAQKCFGKYYNDTTVCSSNGNCISDNVCLCVSGRSGPACEFITLTLNVQGRPTLQTNYVDKLYPTNPIENCASIFQTTELSFFGTDPMCRLSSTGMQIVLGSTFSIRNDLELTTQMVSGVQFKFLVLAGQVCDSFTQSTLTLNLLQPSLLQNLNSDTILRLFETDFSQQFGRNFSWSTSGNLDISPLVIANQKVVIIPKGYWTQSNLPLTVSTTTSLCGTYSTSKTFTFKTDTNMPFIDFMTDTPSSKLNCVGYDCLVEFAIYPSGQVFKPQIKFDGDYSTLVISQTNLQVARLSNYYEAGSYLAAKYTGMFTMELLVNSEKQTFSYPFNYVAFDSSQLFINNLNRGFGKDTNQISFDLVSQNPLLLMVNPSNYPIKYTWIISSGNTTIGTSTSSTISIPNPGVGNYSLSFQVSNGNGLSENIYGIFAILDIAGAIPDFSVQSLTTPYPFIKTLDLTVFINSTSTVSQISWAGLGTFYNSPVLSNFVTNTPLSQNNVKTTISIPVAYLKEGSSYIFELKATNTYGTNVQRINVRMDYNPRFSCDYYASYSFASDSKIIVSCSSFENNLSAYVIDLYTSDLKQRVMTLSNTVKSSVISRIPYSSSGLSFVIKAVNRNGSFRKIVKPITGLIFKTPSPDISSRVTDASQQWTKVKSENVKMDTASSILELLTYLQNDKQTYEDFSGMNDATKQKMTDIITEMISYLKSITTIGYRADDKIGSILLSPTLKLVKLVKAILPTIFTNQKSDIQLLASFIVKGIESVNRYYTQNIVLALVDGATFNDTISLVQNVYSSVATSGLLPELTRLQLATKPDSSPLNLVSYQSPQEISGKTIELGSSIRFTFPQTFHSGLSSVPFSLVSSQESTSSTSPTVTISLFKSDGSVFKIEGLTNYIEIIFSDLDLKTENVSCVYFNEATNAWSLDGLRTTVTKKVSGSGYNVKCETNHLTAFSVISNEVIITPTTSAPKNGTTNTSDVILGIALGIAIPVVVLMIASVVLSIILLVVCLRKKKDIKPKQEDNKRQSVYEEPHVSAYQPMKTNDNLTDTELSVISDFPTNNSMFIKPLMSVYSSTGSSSSTSSKFDPMSRYKNLVRIGQGAFGSVFRAEDSKCNNQTKALKVIKYSSVEELNNILKEGNRLMNITHPYILKVNDVLIDSEQILCIDMDYYEKGDLNQFVKIGSECPESILKQVLFQMCTALDYVHNNLQIVHRDIKPSNIFIKELSKDSIHLILADFGLARQTQGSVMFSYAGTPLFMSTELALGGKYTANTDTYSLGVTLYQIITKDTETSLSHLSLSMDTAEFEKTIRNKMKEANTTLPDTLLDIIVSMLKRDFATRPYPRDILANTYFDDCK